MSDKELKLIESIKAECKSSAQTRINRAIKQFLGEVGAAKINGRTVAEVIKSELDYEQLTDSLASAMYEQTLDSETSAYQKNSSIASIPVRNIQVQINGQLVTHISSSTEEAALEDLKVKTLMLDKRLIKTVIVQDKLVNLITE
jgi:hypothetical protein